MSYSFTLTTSGFEYLIKDFLPMFEANYSFHYLLLDKTFWVYVDNAKEVKNEEDTVRVTIVTDYEYFLNLVKDKFPQEPIIDFNDENEYPELPFDFQPQFLDALHDSASLGSSRLIFGGSKGQKVQEG